VNTFKTNGVAMNHKNLQNTNVFEQQLYEARNSLFAAQSVKQVKFLQAKIKYLKQKIKETEK